MKVYRSTGRVLLERLWRYLKLMKSAEKMGFVEDFMHRAWELMEVAGTLHKEKRLTDLEFEQFGAARKEFERAYPRVKIEVVFDDA